MRSIAFHSAAALAAAALAACGKPAPPPPQAPPVTVAAALTRQVSDFDEFTGRVAPVNQVEVRPRVSGFVRRVAFREGAEVRQGDVLFEIDPRPYQDDVARAAAELQRARTRLQLARSESERAQRLVSSEAISREEAESRTSSSAEAAAGVQAAEAALRSARLNLSWTVVRAPISGRVSRAEVTEGNLVQAGPPAATLLTTVVSVDPVYVYFDGDEQAYLRSTGLAGGARQVPVFMGLANEAGYPRQGVIDFVDNALDPATGTIRVRARFANPDRRLTPGLFARLRLAGTQAYTATLVRDEAVGTDQDRKFVLVVGKDGTANYRGVTLGPVVDGLRVVRSGLQGGEQIVINGLQRVRPGSKVQPTVAPMEPVDSAKVAMTGGAR
ncbi:MAG TPA: efflux RND transporter periplasmic adaptor subunit [Longimicrobium sp.]|nr:efflux RND transporter periplasmic adaptor subunit [Longimicrobium sp.]